MESYEDSESTRDQCSNSEIHYTEVAGAGLARTRQQVRRQLASEELVACKDCAFCCAVDYEFCGRSKILHECRKDAPMILFHETTWPVINIETGCCGAGRKKRALRKND